MTIPDYDNRGGLRSEAPDRVVSALRNKYTLIGNQHIKAWHISLILGVFAGVIGTLFFISNRSGEFDTSKAAFRGAASTTPMITVLFPNGGEKLFQGSTTTIRWSSTGTSSIPAVAIMLNKAFPPAKSYIIATSTINTGVFAWKISTSTTAGLYLVQISAMGTTSTSSAISDTSDRPFSIAATSTASTSPQQ